MTTNDDDVNLREILQQAWTISSLPPARALHVTFTPTAIAPSVRET